MSPPGFTGGTLDRADHLRSDDAALAAAIADPRSRLLALDGLRPDTSGDRLAWLPLSRTPADATLILLGLDAGGRAHFAAHDSALELDSAPAMRSPELMAALAGFALGEAATYAAARSVIGWHARNGFCANCGHHTTPFRAGWGRACPNCGAEHFPRVDPVVIMIAEHDGRALVGRGTGWPEGRYSALAGFLEPGESIEEAVAREVFEEVGVRITDVRYVASQPWPFPSSLMIACIGRSENDALTLDNKEIEDAMWVTKEEVRAALAYDDDARFAAPPPYAIANTLLTGWANG